MNLPSLFLYGNESTVIKVCMIALKQAGFDVSLLPDLEKAYSKSIAKPPAVLIPQHDGKLHNSTTAMLYRLLRANPKTLPLPIIILQCEHIEACLQYGWERDNALALLPIVFTLEELRSTIMAFIHGEPVSSVSP